MLVHDVIQYVPPTAMTSWPTGHWWVASFDDAQAAEWTAATYNYHAGQGVTYYVEAIDELDPERKQPMRSASNYAVAIPDIR